MKSIKDVEDILEKSFNKDSYILAENSLFIYVFITKRGCTKAIKDMFKTDTNVNVSFTGTVKPLIWDL